MGKSHEIRKRQIIESVLELAAEHGLSKVTTQLIADHVGIAQPTVFRHFKNREVILHETFDYVVNGLGELTAPIFAEDGDESERLQRILRTHLGYVGQMKGFPRFLFSDALHLESPALKQRVQGVMNVYAERLAELLQEGVGNGVFRADLDSASCANFIIANIQGLLMRWSLDDFSYRLEDRLDSLWQFLWPALRTNR
jgi:AcrR family transcriptional regulator